MKRGSHVFQYLQIFDKNVQSLKYHLGCSFVNFIKYCSHHVRHFLCAKTRCEQSHNSHSLSCIHRSLQKFAFDVFLEFCYEESSFNETMNNCINLCLMQNFLSLFCVKNLKENCAIFLIIIQVEFRHNLAKPCKYMVIQ